jgi:prepilin-type N-terminal cleavage/methylation domain-containing protein
MQPETKGPKPGVDRLDVNDRGFTLIELLVAVAIIGILAAIAIPIFAEYKVRSFNTTALASLRESVTAQEVAYADNERYVSCVSPFDCELNLPAFHIAISGGQYTINPIRHDAGLDGKSFSAFAGHIRGNKTQRYDSSTGIFVHD